MPALLPAPTAAPAIRTLTAPNSKTVRTAYSYGEAFRLMRRHESAFAAKLVAIVEAGEALTLNQAIYVYVLAEEVKASVPAVAEVLTPEHAEAMLAAAEIAEMEAAEAAPVAPIAPAPFASIIALFQTARDGGSKRLRVRVAMGGVPLVLSNAAENGRNAGGVNVKAAYMQDADGDVVYFGCITPEGGFKPSPQCTGDVLRTLEQFAKDPAGACAAYGQRTGECCFCGRLLTDDGENRSVTVGYGPKCAARFSLPWGAKNA